MHSIKPWLLGAFSLCLHCSLVYAQTTNFSEQSNFLVENSIQFIENKGQVRNQLGQTRNDVLFYGSAGPLSFHLRNDGINYQLSNQIEESLTIQRVELDWKGISNDVKIEKGTLQTERRNFYNLPKNKVVTGVRCYNSITYKDVYPGIDIKWYSRNGSLEYDLILAPKADLNQVKWKINGAENLKINVRGELEIQTELGTIIEEAPIAFQGERNVQVRFTLTENIVGFEAINFNSNLALVIDPVLRVWGTYYGGFYIEEGTSSAVDDTANIYIAGITNSSNQIATSGSYQNTYVLNTDGFMAKITHDGYRAWSTYYGGRLGDYIEDCNLDKDGYLYVAGFTGSDSNIASPSSFQAIDSGGIFDGFLAKFNQQGTREWGTYFGSTSQDRGYACDTDQDGNVYFAGQTASSAGLATPGSHQTSSNGLNAFLVKFDSTGNRSWSTYFGSTYEIAYGLSVDDSARIYLTGITNSNSGLATTGAHQTSKGGGEDAFISQFDSAGTLKWATYYGGALNDQGFSVAASGDTMVYIAGTTGSPGTFPSCNNCIGTSGSHQPLNGGNNDGFLVKFTSNGTRVWGTYYGGSAGESGTDCDVDGKGEVYLTGSAVSDSLIATNGNHLDQRAGNADGYLAKFSTSGARIWGSYIGGPGDDEIYSVNVLDTANIYVVGTTGSNSNISTQFKHQITKGGLTDAFIQKLSECDNTYDSISVSTCGIYTSPSGRHHWNLSGDYLDTIPNNAGCDSVLFIHLDKQFDTFTLDVSSCEFYETPSGANTHFQSGTYVDTLFRTTGCDTIYTINLTIDTFPDTSIVHIPGGLQAEDSNATTYQWLDCDNDLLPISGEDSIVFLPILNGKYALRVTNGTCADTSDCQLIDWIGIASHDKSNSIILYPNPNSGTFEIKISRNISIENIQLFDQLLKKVEIDVSQKEELFQIELLNPKIGVYYLQLEIDGVIQTRIVLINN